MSTQFHEKWCLHLAEIGNGNSTTLRRIQTTEERICKIIGPDYIVGSVKYTYFSCRLLFVDTASLALSLLVLKHCSLGFARRMKTQCLNSEKQSQIVGMHKVGAKGVEIAAELGHPKTTVYTVIKRFESRGTVEGPKSTGRPQKLSEHSCRIVTCALLTNRRQILTDLIWM